MKFQLTKQPKTILLFALTVALLGGVSYGGYRYWQFKQVISEPQEPAEPIEEKSYEIIDNPDGSRTFVCYKFNFKFNYPDTWEFSEEYSNLRGATGSDKVGAVKVLDEGGGGYMLISVGLLRDKSRFPTLRDLLIYLSSKSEISAEPNFEVSGIPAFKFLLQGYHVKDTTEIYFEHNGQTFKISFPWGKRDDPEYKKVLESFEFIN